MERGDRLPEWCAESLCAVCPAQVLGVGDFDVTDRPGPDSHYDPQVGYRVNRHPLAATCVHPFRVGLPAARYDSDHTPLPKVAPPTPAPAPVHLELPADAADLAGGSSDHCSSEGVPCRTGVVDRRCQVHHLGLRWQ